MKQTAEIAVPEVPLGCAQQLARFFPQAASVRVAIQVTAVRGGRASLCELATVDFAAREVAIFLSTLPLEFDDRVRLEPTQKGSTVEATVVAVQYHEGCKAVAVKFIQGSCDWVTQP